MRTPNIGSSHKRRSRTIKLGVAVVAGAVLIGVGVAVVSPNTRLQGQLSPIASLVNPEYYPRILECGYTQHRLVISGRILGEIEPCGCTKPQLGGLSRRAAVNKVVEATSLPAVVTSIDTGDSIHPEWSLKVRRLKQLHDEKAKIISRHLAGANARVAIGCNDLVYSDESSNSPGGNEKTIPSNIMRHNVNADSARVQMPGDLKVISVFDADTLKAKGLYARGMRCQDPGSFVKQAALGTTGLILISNVASKATLAGILRDNPKVVLVVDNGFLIDDSRGGKQLVSGISVVRVPDSGTHFVVVDLFIRDAGGGGGRVVDLATLEALTRLQVQFQARDAIPSIASRDEAEVSNRKRVKGGLEEQWRQIIEGNPVLMRIVEIPLSGNIKPDPEMDGIVRNYFMESERFKVVREASQKNSITYKSAASCRECHKANYEAWAMTSHAHAYDTLVKKKVEKNAECFSCHSTGFLMEGGPQSMEEALPFANVQCSGCHVPDGGGVHPGLGKFRTITSTTCLECHTKANSPKFDYADYLPRATCIQVKGK